MRLLIGLLAPLRPERVNHSEDELHDSVLGIVAVRQSTSRERDNDGQEEQDDVGHRPANV